MTRNCIKKYRIWCFSNMQGLKMPKGTFRKCTSLEVNVIDWLAKPLIVLLWIVWTSKFDLISYPQWPATGSVKTFGRYLKECCNRSNIAHRNIKKLRNHKSDYWYISCRQLPTAGPWHFICFNALVSQVPCISVQVVWALTKPGICCRWV